MDIKKNGLDRRQQSMLEEKESTKAQNQGKAADEKPAALRTDAQGIAEDDDVALANDVNDVAAVDPAAGVQPEDWRKSKLVVVDPFLTAKVRCKPIGGPFCFFLLTIFFVRRVLELRQWRLSTRERAVRSRVPTCRLFIGSRSTRGQLIWREVTVVPG